MTLSEQIKRIEAKNPQQIVSLANKYGVFWIGQARFVFGAVSREAWEGTHITVKECRNG